MNKNVFFALSSVLVIYLSYYLNYKIPNYPLTIYSPILMLLGYLPIALIERRVLEKTSNNVIKTIISLHVAITLFMIIVYLIVIVVLNLIG